MGDKVVLYKVAVKDKGEVNTSAALGVIAAVIICIIYSIMLVYYLLLLLLRFGGAKIMSFPSKATHGVLLHQMEGSFFPVLRWPT